MDNCHGGMLHWEKEILMNSWCQICPRSCHYDNIRCLLWQRSWHCDDSVYMPNQVFNSLRPRQNERHFTDDIFKCVFVNENVSISIKISLNSVAKGPINNIPTLVQIMACRRPGDKPLSEPMMVNLPSHICVTRPQWVKGKGLIIKFHCYMFSVIAHPCPLLHPDHQTHSCLSLMVRVIIFWPIYIVVD